MYDGWKIEEWRRIAVEYANLYEEQSKELLIYKLFREFIKDVYPETEEHFSEWMELLENRIKQENSNEQG